MIQSDYPLISVIIPIYNAEKYLIRCIESVLGQTYPNIEIILVNDGSTDHSQIICEEYQRNHSNIKVFNKVNGGQSSARNLGLDMASGEYIGFIDGDDWISIDMYSTLYNLIKNYNADCSQIKIKLTDSKSNYLQGNDESFEIISGRENILRYYLDSGTKRSGEYSVCSCLFHSKICNKIRFREGALNEDIDYKYKVLSECNKWVVSNKVCYFYFQSGNSSSSGILKKKDLDLYLAADELERLTENESDDKIKYLVKIKKARTPFSLLCRVAYYGIDSEIGDKKTFIKKLISEHRNNLPILLKSSMPINRKVIAILLYINYNCVGLPLKLIKKLK